jgi:hypothetical protein
MNTISDKNGVYNLSAVCAITRTNDKEETAVLHMAGGQVLSTLIPFADAVKAYDSPEPAAPAAPAAAEPAPAA